MEYSPGTTTPNTPLRRRNSISTSVVLPEKLSLTSTFPNGSSSTATATATAIATADDFELITIKPLSYTSLKDLLPSASASVHSPKPTTPASGYEISIRNRLVKQAAWAYLQPMSTSPDSSGRHFLHTIWVQISGDYLKNRLASFLRVITRAFDRMLRAICVRNSR